MVYFYLKQVDDPVFEGAIPVYVCNEKGVLTENLLRDGSLLSSVSSVVPHPRVVWIPGNNVPVITFDSNVPNLSMFFNLTQYIGIIRNLIARYGSLDDTMKNQVITMFSKQVNSKVAEFIYEVCLAHIGFEDGQSLSYPINIDAGFLAIGDLATVTTKALEKHNSQFKTVFKSMSGLDNVTVYQQTYTDELFIKIPDRSLLLTQDNIKWEHIIPKRSEVCSPYSDQNAYSPEYKSRNVPDYLIADIEGRKENDYLPIQDNERKYYDALADWIKYNIKEEFGSEGNIIDAVSKEYLTELAQRVYSWHWSHNPNIPISFIDEDADGADQTSNEVASKYEFLNTGDISKLDNAVLALEVFLDNASAELGYKVYPEAIVKLARWGKRKGTVLNIDGYSLVFDLATNKTRRDLGSISDYKIRLVDGKQYKFVCWITPSFNAADKAFNKRVYNNVPIGMVLKSFLSADDGSEIDVPVYYSMFDAISMLESGELAIAGLGEPIASDISISILTNDYLANSGDFLQNPFWRSQELKNLCIEFGTSKGDTELNLMSIFDSALMDSNLSSDLEAFAVSSITDLEEKIKAFKIYSKTAALSTGLAGIMFPSIDRAADLISGGTDVITAWKDALSLWKGVRAVFRQSVSQSVVTEPVVIEPQPQPSVQPIRNFADAQPTPQSSIQPQPIQSTVNNTGFNLILEVSPEMTVAKVVAPNGSLIGGYVRDIYSTADGVKKKRYIMLDKISFRAIPEERREKVAVNVFKVLPYMVRDVEAFANGAASEAPVCFCSKEAVRYYVKVLFNVCSAMDSLSSTLLLGESNPLKLKGFIDQI